MSLGWIRGVDGRLYLSGRLVNIPFSLAPADGRTHFVAAISTPTGTTYYLDGKKQPGGER